MDFNITQTNKGKMHYTRWTFLSIRKRVKRRHSFLEVYSVTCKGRFYTDSEIKEIVKVTTEHNHKENERKVEVQQLRVRIKRKASVDDIMF